MATIYVSEQGAVISKTSRRLVVSKDSAVILELPIFKIERIFIFGNIQITTQAMNFLLENNIDVSFFTMRGRCHGRLAAMESKNIFLRVNMLRKYVIYKSGYDSEYSDEERQKSVTGDMCESNPLNDGSFTKISLI